MPRKSTNTAAANAWIRGNKHWLTADHEPMVQQVRDLAASMDEEMRLSGRVNAALASAYRSAYRTLMELKPIEQIRRDKLEAETDTLMSPGAWQA